jgi:thiol-disulfide isomerase/thioredoxin
MGGLIVLVVLVAASGAGVLLRRRQGTFKATAPQGGSTPPDGTAPLDGTAPREGVLTPEDLGAPLGERATLVQFSTEFCASCPPTKRMLGQVAAEHQGVELVEVDAAARLDLARRLHVYTTPTILVLDPDGTITSRASGQPRKSDVLAAIGSVRTPGVSNPGVSNPGVHVPGVPDLSVPGPARDGGR